LHQIGCRCSSCNCHRLTPTRAEARTYAAPAPGRLR
jgi:hypothetical protein